MVGNGFIYGKYIKHIAIETPSIVNEIEYVCPFFNNKMKTIAESETIYTELMIPTYANFGGKVHGGIILSIMDKVAYVCASKHSGSYVVTVAVEGVEFLSPVEVGDLLTIKASINYVGNTTMIVGMRTECFNPRTGHTRHTNSCYFTMAAKNDDGTLKEVPGLIISNHQQLVRFCEGKLIRDLSKKKREALKNNFAEYSVKELKELCSLEKCNVEFLK
jgi:acyl-CoA hydrolase